MSGSVWVCIWVCVFVKVCAWCDVECAFVAGRVCGHMQTCVTNSFSEATDNATVKDCGMGFWVKGCVLKGVS